MPLNIQGKVVGLEESIRRVEHRFNRIGGGLKVRINEKEFTQPLGKITHSANEFSKSLEASNARVIAFGASAAIIGGVTIAFKELVVQSIKFEKILTDINVVLGTTSSNLNKFGKNLFNVARNTSQAIDVVAEAALEFSRQGLSMEETLRRTNDALILVRLTGMKAADAVSGLTAAMNGFADAGLSTTNIINKLAAVDVKFAVSADDLVNALARAGAVAQDAGVSFDQLIGAVTSAQQITARGGAVIGNSFKTIFTRVQRSSTIDRLQELGVAVRDIRGSTLPALTVLKNLSTQYDKLADTTKAAVAEQVGGVFQINILKAALKDLNRENSLYAQATDISANATNQAQIKNEQLQKTLSSLAAQTSLTVQELSANIGELALSPGISKILDAINSAGQALNDLFGKDSEGFGSDIAKGLVKGIGGAITGPGMVVAIGIFAKLFKNALSFSKDSLKDVLGIVTAKDKEKQIQRDIVEAMRNNKDLAHQLDSLSHDKVAQEKEILTAIKQQTTALERQQSIARGLAPGLVAKGVKPGLTMGKKKASSGLIPEDVISERMGALSGGYAPGAVKTMKVQGLGQVVYNGAETVKNFKGMSQPAIMPPQHSRAGSSYQKDFQQKHGFDPYAFGGFIPNFMDSRTRQQKIKDALSDPANKNIKFKMPGQKIIKSKNMWDQEILRMFQQNPRQKYLGKPLIEYLTGKGYDRKTLQAMSKNPSNFKVMSDGFVPNFAAIQIDDKLKLPKAKMLVEHLDHENVHKSLKGWRDVTVPVTPDLLKKGTTKDTGITKALRPPFESLMKLGIREISRPFFFTSFSSMKNPNLDKAGRDKIWKNLLKNSPLKGNNKIGDALEGDLLNNPILKKQGYMSTGVNRSEGGKTVGLETAKLDLISAGRIPIEAKAVKGGASKFFKSIMMKSLRITGDRYIEKFLDDNGMKEASSKLKTAKEKEALREIRFIVPWAKMGVKQDKLDQSHVQKYKYSNGLIPNFANPLIQAVAREKAAGVPSSMIRVGQDDSLRSPANPMGLGVTNTRDEPLGIQQGIRRAKEMGISPQTHGASLGFIPNFQKKMESQSNERTVEASGNLMMGMFALTTATYALESALGDSESAFAQGTKVVNGFVMGASQGAMVFSGLNDVGKSLSNSQNKFSKLIGGPLLRGLGAIGGIAALAVPAFQAIKENTTLLDTGLDTLRKSAEKTSKGLEGLNNAISATNDLETTKKELTELTNSSLIDTFDGQLKRIELETKITNQQTELQKSTETLSSALNLSGDEIQVMLSGTSEGMKKLQENMLLYSQQLQSNRLAQGRVKAREGDMTAGEKTQVAAKLTFSEIAPRSSSLFAQNPEAGLFDRTTAFSKDIGSFLLGNIRGGEKIGNALGIENIYSKDKAKVPTMQLTDEELLGGKKSGLFSRTNEAELQRQNIGVARQIASSDVQKEAESIFNFENFNFDKDFKALEDRVKEGLLSDDFKTRQAATIIGGQMEGLSNESSDFEKGSFSQDMQTIFGEYLQKFVSDKKEEESIRKGDIDYSRKILQMRKDLAYNTQREYQLSLDAIDIAKARASQKSTIDKINLEYNAQLGIVTKAKQVDEEIAAQKKSQADNHTAALDKIEAERIKAIQSQIKNIIDTDKKSPQFNSALFSFSGDAVTKEQRDEDFKKKRGQIASTVDLSGFAGRTGPSNALRMAESFDAIKAILEKWLTDLAKTGEATAAISAISESLLDPSKQILQKFERINEDAGRQADKEKELNDIKLEEIDAGRKNLEANSKTISFYKDRLKTLDNLRKSSYLMYWEQEKARNFKLKGDLREIENHNFMLKNQEGLGILVENEMMNRQEALALTDRSLIIERALIEDKEKLKELVAEQVRQEEEKADIARVQARETHSQKMSKGIYGKEASRARESNLEQMQGKGQALASDVNFYAAQGNVIRHAESYAEFAKHQKELNIEMNTGTLFADSLAVKIAEANEELSKFGETLANTTFDATKEAFKGLVASMSDGTKSMGDAMLQFVGTIAGRIHEKLLDRAATQITTALFEMSGLADNGFYKGGVVQGYANGGITSSHSRQVPSMLTAGEYVVRKKVVDRLGKGALDSINESGSLEDLYEKPNDDLFDITSEGAAMVPAIMRSPESLGIASRRSAYIGSSDKSENKLDTSESDSIIGKFASIVDSFGSKLAAFRYGGGVQPHIGDPMENDLIQNADKQLTRKKSLEKLAKGAGYIAGSSVAAYQNREDTGPQAPIAPVHQMINTRSRLNLDSRSDQMSAKFRATDQYSQDYGKYLLDKYEYDVQQNNAKVQRRAQVAQTIAGIPMTYMLGSVISKGSKMISSKVDSFVEKYKTNKMLKTFEQDGMSFNKSKSPQSSSPESTRSSISSALGFSPQTSQQLQDFRRSNPSSKQPLSQSLQNSVSHMQTSNQSSNFDYSKTHGANLLNSYTSHQSKNQNSSTLNQGKQYVHNLLQRNNQGGLINSISNNNPYSYFYRGGNVNSSASKTGAFSYFNQGGNVSFASNANPYSYFYRGGSVNSSVAHSSPYSYFHQGGKVNMSSQSNPYSYFYKGGSVSSSVAHSNPYSYFNQGGKVNVSSQSNPYSYFYKGGNVNSSFAHSSPYSYFHQGGKVNMSSQSNPYSYFYRGGKVNISNFNQNTNSKNSSSFNTNKSSNESRLNTHAYTNQQMSTFFNSQGSSDIYSNSPYSYSNKQNYNYLQHGPNRHMQGYSSGGKVYGPGGIDKVGPVLLDKGEYVIKASSVNKVEKKYPGFFDRLNSMKMKDGGLVDSGSSSTDITNKESNESSSSNVTVNINVSSGGNTSIDGGDGNQQAFAAKVKDAVLGVISQEKRVGGMLRGR